MKTLVSIIVPVYKVEQYLTRCVESIVAQTYSHLEIILVDDGSPDGSGVLCDTLASKDARIKVIHKENGGVASARNAGMEAATGVYLMFVDSDDYIKSHMVEALVRSAIETKADLVIGGYTVLARRGTIDRTFGGGVYSGPEQISALLDRKIGDSILNTCWGKLYRADAIREKQDSAFPIGEDWVFNIVNLKHMQKIALLDEELYFYECRNQSITRSKYKLNSAILNHMYSTILHELEDLYHSEPMLFEIRKRHLYALLEDAQKTPHSLRALNRRLHEIKREHADTINALDCKEGLNRYLKKKSNFSLIRHFRWISAKGNIKALAKKVIAVFKK